MNTSVVARNQALQEKGLPLSGVVNFNQAKAIIASVWKGAPEIEQYKAAMLCQDFGLHPLMNHVYLIKYNRYEGRGPDRRKVGAMPAPGPIGSPRKP